MCWVTCIIKSQVSLNLMFMWTARKQCYWLWCMFV